MMAPGLRCMRLATVSLLFLAGPVLPNVEDPAAEPAPIAALRAQLNELAQRSGAQAVQMDVLRAGTRSPGPRATPVVEASGRMPYPALLEWLTGMRAVAGLDGSGLVVKMKQEFTSRVPESVQVELSIPLRAAREGCRLDALARLTGTAGGSHKAFDRGATSVVSAAAIQEDGRFEVSLAVHTLDVLGQELRRVHELATPASALGTTDVHLDAVHSEPYRDTIIYGFKASGRLAAGAQRTALRSLDALRTVIDVSRECQLLHRTFPQRYQDRFWAVGFERPRPGGRILADLLVGVASIRLPRFIAVLSHHRSIDPSLNKLLVTQENYPSPRPEMLSVSCSFLVLPDGEQRSGRYVHEDLVNRLAAHLPVNSCQEMGQGTALRTLTVDAHGEVRVELESMHLERLGRAFEHVDSGRVLTGLVPARLAGGAALGYATQLYALEMAGRLPAAPMNCAGYFPVWGVIDPLEAVLKTGSMLFLESARIGARPTGAVQQIPLEIVATIYPAGLEKTLKLFRERFPGVRILTKPDGVRIRISLSADVKL